MKRQVTKFLFGIVIFLQAYSVSAGNTVTVTGVSPEYLTAYYEGVAKVAEATSKIQFLFRKRNQNSNDIAVFLAGNSLNPIASVIGLPDSNEKLSGFEEGVLQAAQLYGIDQKSPCMSPSQTLSRTDVENAINKKFEGVFERKHLGVLVVGALEELSERYPCN